MVDNSLQQEFIDEIQILASDLGHPPREAEIVRYLDASLEDFVSIFGSLSNARDAAGLDSPRIPTPSEPVENGPNRTGGTPSHDDLLQDLYLTLNAVGHTPSREEIQEYGIYAPEDFSAQFGSLAAAVERVKEALNGELYQIDSLLEYLKELSRYHDRPPLLVDILVDGRVPLQKYNAYWDSWVAALNDAGFTTPGYASVSRESLLNSVPHKASSANCC